MKRVIFLLALALAGPVESAPPLEETVEQSYAVTAGATLSVHNTDGAIFIYGAEPGEMKIFARKRAYSKARLDGIQIKVANKDGQISIDTLYPPKPDGLSLAPRSGTVDYTILVPETCTVARADLDNGEIILQDLRGDRASAHLGNGRLITRDCFCGLDLAVKAGGIEIFYNWWEAKSFQLSAAIAQGHIRALLPPQPLLRIEAASKDGSVTNAFADDPKKSARTLSVTFGEEAASFASFQLRASGGNIKIEKGY